MYQGPLFPPPMHPFKFRYRAPAVAAAERRSAGRGEDEGSSWQVQQRRREHF